MRRSASALGIANTPSRPSQSPSNRGHSAASKRSGASSPRDPTHEHMAKTLSSESSTSPQSSSSRHSCRSPRRASKRRASVSESAIQSSTSGNRDSQPTRTQCREGRSHGERYPPDRPGAPAHRHSQAPTRHAPHPGGRAYVRVRSGSASLTEEGPSRCSSSGQLMRGR